MKKLFAQSMLTLSFVLLATLSIKAQFNISGEFRPRIEYRDGYLQTGDSTMKGYTTILGRSRVFFDFNQEKISVRFAVQHAFTYGENLVGSDTISKNTVNIFEGWFRFGFSKNLGIKTGRMMITYDDQRIFGGKNWSQFGSAHDMVMMQINGGTGYRGDVGFAINNMAPANAYLSSYNLKNYKYMLYSWNNKKFFNESLNLSLLAILDVNQKSSLTYNKVTNQTLWVVNGQDTVGSTTISNTTKVTETYPDILYGRGTMGLYATYNYKKLFLSGSGYYQTGHYKDGREISAFLLAGAASYQFLKWMKLGVAYDYLSGNDFSDTATMRKTVKGFSSPWGTTHLFYGYMDMFTSYLNRDNLQFGLQQLYFRGTFSLNDKTAIEATYRMFSMPHGFLPSSATIFTPADKSLGSELDLMITCKALPNLDLNGAYCYYFSNETREKIDGLKPGTGRNGQFVYFMITYKPFFFTSEKKS